MTSSNYIFCPTVQNPNKLNLQWFKNTEKQQILKFKKLEQPIKLTGKDQNIFNLIRSKFCSFFQETFKKFLANKGPTNKSIASMIALQVTELSFFPPGKILKTYQFLEDMVILKYLVILFILQVKKLYLRERLLYRQVRKVLEG